MAAGTTPPPWDDVARLLGPAPSVPRVRARLVVWLRGEQDLSTAVRLAQTLAEATAAGDGDLVVDLSQVEFMDARILTTLIRGRNALLTRSRNLTLRAPSSSARRILALCGLLELVDPVPPIDTGERDPRTTIPDTWSRTPLEGRAVEAIPRIGRPQRYPPLTSV